MLKNNQKGGRSSKTQPQFQQSDFRGLFRERKRPIEERKRSIEDPQIDLGLAQDRTYKVRKQKGRQISGPKGRIRDTQI